LNRLLDATYLQVVSRGKKLVKKSTFLSDDLFTKSTRDQAQAALKRSVEKKNMFEGNKLVQPSYGPGKDNSRFVKLYSKDFCRMKKQ